MGSSMLPNLPPQNISSPRKYLFQTWIVHTSSTDTYRYGLAALTKVPYVVDPRIRSHGKSVGVAISIVSPTPGVAYHESEVIFPSIRLTLLNGTLADTIRSRPLDWQLCYSLGLLDRDDFAYCTGIPELQELAPFSSVEVTTLESRIFRAWLLDTATAKTEANVQVQYSITPSSWDFIVPITEPIQRSHLLMVVGLEGSGHKAMAALWPSLADQSSDAQQVLFGLPNEWDPSIPPSDMDATRSRITARLNAWEQWQLSKQRIIDDNGDGEAVLVFSTSYPYGNNGPFQRVDLLTFLEVVDPDSSQWPIVHSSSVSRLSKKSPFASVLILALDRDPVACLLSAVRQNLASKGIEHQATVVADNLMYLSAQLATLPCSRYRVIHYDAFVNNPQEAVNPLLNFFKLRRHLIFPDNVRPPRNGTRQALERAAMVHASPVIRYGIAHPRHAATWETFSNPKCPLISNKFTTSSDLDYMNSAWRDIMLEVETDGDGKLNPHELYEWLRLQ